MNRYDRASGCSVPRQRHEQLLIVEKRKSTPEPLTINKGWQDESVIDYYPMDLSEPQPPSRWVHGVTENDLCDYYFRETRDTVGRTLDWIYGWFRAQGWHVRAKTW